MLPVRSICPCELHCPICHWRTHFLPPALDDEGLSDIFLIMMSSQSNKQLMSHFAFSNAVASHPIVSMLSLLLFDIHSRSISRIISNVLVLLLFRSCSILFTVSPSSRPRCRYCLDILPATSSSSSGNTLMFASLTRGFSWIASQIKVMY